jgi:ABC-type multidrug transport system fused ATPase/permease subunit
MECVAVAGLVVVALLSSMGKGGEVPLGELTFLGFAAYRLLPALQQAFAAIVRIRADRPGFSAVAADLRLARNRRNPDVAADPTWAAAPESQIVLQDVSFHYDPQRAPAVSQLSLRIPARGCIGLVGANGSGKTTVVDLIAGLLVPESGWITVDGTRLNEANRAAWRRRIAYVPQSCYLLDASIAQNVAFGIDSGSVNRERLLEAAGLAQLDEFVAALPGGYDHTVGERGVWLSGGQRQRLGIARALYAEASVLILDEATNALDGLTEQELMATIARLRGSYTILLIAHRLSTVRDCDLIVELDRGSVVASGTYTELLGKSETFRRMVDAAV